MTRSAKDRRKISDDRRGGIHRWNLKNEQRIHEVALVIG